MSTHRAAKQPFSRLSDGQSHPVVVRHRADAPAYDTTLDPISPDFDIHSWGAFGDHPLSSIVGTDYLGEINPEPQKVRVEKPVALVAVHDPSEMAVRRPGIPVPQMDRMHPIGHVDAIANTHGDDR